MKNRKEKLTDAHKMQKVRLMLSLSQTGIARSLGCSSGLISQIEKGRKRISLSLIKTLAQKFNVSTLWLFIGEGDVFEHSDTAAKKSKPTASEVLADLEIFMLGLHPDLSDEIKDAFRAFRMTKLK